MDACIQKLRPGAMHVRKQLSGRPGHVNYHVAWNAFKKIAGTYPPHEKDAMFFRTAAATYRLSEMKKETR